jgi:glucose uptake protein GlcU
MDFYQLIGYFTGLLIVRPNIEPGLLLTTALLVHSLDAVLCAVIAHHSRRNRLGWTVAGLLCGIWALGALFLLPAKKQRAS